MTRASSTHKGESQRFASFVVTGGLAAGVNLLSRWLLSHLMIYELAVALAYLLGMTTAFILAKRFVFASGGTHWLKEYGRFAVVNSLSFLVVLGTSVGLARGLFPAIEMRWYPEEVAHLIGVMSPLVLSYYAHKHFTFGHRNRQPKERP